MFAVPFLQRALCAASLVLFFCAIADTATAQQLQGRVLLEGSGVQGVEVEFHRVTRDAAGVVGRTTTGAQGTFSIPFPPADTAGFTVYFATAEYHGIRYFGTPLHPNDPRDEYLIAVYDTVAVGSAGASVRVARRDLVLLPDPAGGWEVNEIVQLHNPGTQTLVARQAMPSWELRLPSAAEAIEVGEGDLDETDLVRMGDRVLLNAPIVPGIREIFVRYRIPARPDRFRIPLDTPTDSLNLFVLQPAPALMVEGMRARDAVQAEGSEFLRYGAADLGPDAVVSVGWRSGGSPINPTVAALAVLGVLLLLGAAAAVWRGPRGGAGQPPKRVVPVGTVVREPAASAESAA